MPLISCERHPTDTIHRNPDKEQLLSNYFVTSICFDSFGTAWLGTFKQGLIKYDDQDMIVYDDLNSPINDTMVIYDIEIDSKGNVWIATDGLIKFDGDEFILYNSSNSDVPEDFVSCLEIDSKDNVWFSSCRFRKGGLVKFDGQVFTAFTPENSDMPANMISSMVIDQNDNLWIAMSEVVNDAFLVKITGNEWIIYDGDDLGFRPYYLGDIALSSENELYVTVDYSLSSTYFNKGPKLFSFNGQKTSTFSNDSIRTIKTLEIDHKDKLYVCTYDDLILIDGDEWKKVSVDFSEKGLFSIKESPEKDIWVGTGGGIFILDI